MLSNITERKGPQKREVRWRRRVASPLLIALMALLVVGVSPGAASSSVPLRPTTASSQKADSAPALIAYNGTLYVGWTGRNAAHNLNLMTYNFASKTFGSAQILTDTTPAGSAPGFAVFNGNLYVGWRGMDNRLNVGRYNPADPSDLASKVTLREYSTSAPSIAATGGRLFLSWRGTDGHLNLLSSADASTFGSKVTYGVTGRTSPSLVASAGYLFLGWEDTSASSPMVIGRYNPSHPGTLSQAVTLASSSQLPVGLAPAGTADSYVNVAWRTATDSHIRLATFKDGQYLHDPVYTTQSTSYGPALALLGSASYMSWTGTDAAQSINVSPANIASPGGVLGYPLYSGNPQLPEIALTFDDGPSAAYTAQILSILQSYGIQATFFVIGSQAANNSNLVLQENQQGYVVGNHTWSHPNLTTLSADQVRSELQSTSSEIASITGQSPIVFRPPGGNFNDQVQSIAASLGLSTVLWSVDPRDWSRPGTDAIIQNVLSSTKNGSIILMHDGGGDRSQTVAALPTIISTLLQRGFRFVTIPRMIQDLGSYTTHAASPAPAQLGPE
ncbi:MAG TPA: polysaccharide deacetylase family protein [Ktedonobacteraceae bacterium]|nr:polysaccharide deacetylase family protein [Ktedonobacteraceae bacterium]